MAARASLLDDRRLKHSSQARFFFFCFFLAMVRNPCHLQKSPSYDANISFVRAHFPVATVEVFFQRRSAAGARASHREIKLSECSLRKRVNPLRCCLVQEAVRVQGWWLRYWTASMFFFCFSFSALLILPTNVGMTNERLFLGKACFVVTLKGLNVASFNLKGLPINVGWSNNGASV